MIVYQTDGDGIYRGPVEARPSPREPGEWLIPGGCVAVAPPDIAEHERARWTGAGWIVEAIPAPPEPEPEPDPDPEPLDAYTARRRWEIETGGITVSGAAIHTDRESQALINGALSLVQADPTATIEFKGAAGWVTLDATQMAAIALAVGRHVQAAFSAERTISQAIAAQEITTVEEVEAAFAALMAPPAP